MYFGGVYDTWSPGGGDVRVITNPVCIKLLFFFKICLNNIRLIFCKASNFIYINTVYKKLLSCI